MFSESSKGVFTVMMILDHVSNDKQYLGFPADILLEMRMLFLGPLEDLKYLMFVLKLIIGADCQVYWNLEHILLLPDLSLAHGIKPGLVRVFNVQGVIWTIFLELFFEELQQKLICVFLACAYVYSECEHK